MYFWRNSLIPKELQEHIEKTFKQIIDRHKGGKPPVGGQDVKYEIDQFLEKAEHIISGSNLGKEKK